MCNPTVIVAHPGRQHSFRVAKALKEGGLLFRYVTTVYNKDDSLLMRFVKLFLNKDNSQRASKRKCPGLDDSDVIQFCELEGILLLALHRIDFTRILSNKVQRYVTNKFQRKLANYIIKNPQVEAVVSYDTNSLILFSILKDKAPNVKLIMDNAHPNRHYLYHSYHENWECVGDFSKTLEACGYLMDSQNAEVYGKEAKLADYHIVASSYSLKALEFDDVPRSRIFKIAYGVDDNSFLKSNRSYSQDKLNVLFVGEVNQRKGIRQVLEAAKIINSDKVVFNIVGLGREYCSDLYNEFNGYVNFLGRVPYEELLHQFSSSHIFLFPTMGEGFGLVLLEAMAAGLPVITTENCGGKDIVLNGKNGFIISVGDTKAIIDKVNWALMHPDNLRQMSVEAIKTAHCYTWSIYEDGIRSAIKQSLEG
ncbi:glycosyltransferase family 4 protein [Parabacteroides merdae]|uniref:glycosyltransferase family 4 protein n=1 Tax=Parabacteroides merdae TaxID=46503 RepID=UPI0022E4D6BB|nr:glycosyltransferase family 4 protein [Parabacteroides merdae]